MGRRDDQTLCSVHNRWYVDGYECPDCERDQALSKQTEYLEQIASATEAKTRAPIEINHAHTHRVAFENMGLVVHVNVEVPLEDPESQERRTMEKLLAFIAIYQVHDQMMTFDEWLQNTGGPSEAHRAAALSRGITRGFLSECNEEDNRIVLKINIEHPSLIELLPGTRNEEQFLKDLSHRLAIAHELKLPEFEGDTDLS